MAGQLFQLGIWTGATGDPVSFHETSSTVFLQGALGKVFSVKNSTLFSPGILPRVYQFILRSSTDAVTLANPGSVAYWKSYDDCTVTSDASDAYEATALNHVAGHFPGTAVLAGEYGFIQVAGVGPVLLQGAPTSAADTSGKPLVAVSGQDLTVNCLADWTGAAARWIGKAITAKNAGSIGTDVIEAVIFPDRVGW